MYTIPVRVNTFDYDKWIICPKSQAHRPDKHPRVAHLAVPVGIPGKITHEEHTTQRKQDQGRRRPDFGGLFQVKPSVERAYTPTHVYNSPPKMFPAVAKQPIKQFLPGWETIRAFSRDSGNFPGWAAYKVLSVTE